MSQTNRRQAHFFRFGIQPDAGRYPSTWRAFLGYSPIRDARIRKVIIRKGNHNPGGSMKISNEQLQALQQITETKGKPKATGGVFDALFSQELAETLKAGESTAAQGVRPAQSVLPPMAAAPGRTGLEAAEIAVLETVTCGIETMLGNLDEYADALANPQGADLRKAYTLLQNLGKDLEELRQNAPDLAARHAGLAALMDEVSIIARAETVKMNRGDYL